MVSLPHEIQRNFTLIREHDSQVKSKLFEVCDQLLILIALNESLYSSLDAFLDSNTPADTKSSLLPRLKDGFLATLSHAEEKVSLAAQCYNAVEKHLCKLEDDLKCFEEEIRLAGYEEILRNGKKAQAASKPAPAQTKKRTRHSTGHSSTNQASVHSNLSVPAKRSRRTSLSDDESGTASQELSRAERLLRRSKPVLQADESVEKSNEGDDESEQAEASLEQSQPLEPAEPVEEAEKKDPLEAAALANGDDSEATKPQRATRSRSNSTSTPGKEPLYCTCKRVSYGQMIACDNKECPVEWFHYSCVGLKTPPKGKWYCSKECQDRKKRNSK